MSRRTVNASLSRAEIATAGATAAQLLDDPVVTRAFEILESGFLQEMTAAPYNEAVLRDAYYKIQALRALKNELRITARNAKITK